MRDKMAFNYLSIIYLYKKQKLKKKRSVFIYILEEDEVYQRFQAKPK